MNLRTGIVAGATLATAAAVSAAATHGFHRHSERSSYSNGWTLAGYAPALLGLGALAGGLLAGRPGAGPGVASTLRWAGAAAIAGTALGWGAYTRLTGNEAYAVPFDPEMRLALRLRTQLAPWLTETRGGGSRPAGAPVPREAGSWTFVAIGDYGSGTHEQEHIAERIDRSAPRFIVTLGDNVQTRGTEHEWQDKWDPPELFGDLREHYPVFPALGNHDIMGEGAPGPYFRRFPELGGAHYYSRAIEGMRFIALDGNQSLEPGSPQHEFLRRELADAREGWKILYLHQPLIDSFHGDERLRQVAPLLEQYGVDLVLAGHQHAYERSNPLNAHGTIQVVAGSGGHSARPFDEKQPAWSAFRDPALGHLEIEVRDDGTELVGRYMDDDGRLVDTWTLRDR